MIFSFKEFVVTVGSYVDRVASRLGPVTRLILIVIALHMPSWFAGWLLQMPGSDGRPLFNVDLLLAAAIASVSALAGVVVLVLVWVAEFLRAAANNYHFISTSDFVDAGRFIGMLNLRPFLSVTLLTIVVSLLVNLWVVLRLTRRSRGIALLLLIAVALATGCDLANGSFNIFGLGKDSRFLNMNFASSPVWNIWSSERQRHVGVSKLSPMSNPVSFRAMRSWQSAHPGRTLVLVLVESMGLPRAPVLQAWLLKRLSTQRLTARWMIRQGEEPFMGSTTFGELRTLCGLQGHYSLMDQAHAVDCLPRVFARQGVASIGIHGFSLRMFDRNDWWVKIGLQPWRWGGDVPMNCNLAFPGVCDSAVIERAMIQAQQPKRFIYALTLDTHLPLKQQQSMPLPEDLRLACVASLTPPVPCQLVHKLGDVLAQIESTLAASKATPYLVVVGDHAPPFGEPANREVFAADRVPFFEIIPR